MDSYLTRRDNILMLVRTKFQGNRAAFARASQIHPNHINLVLTTNDLHRRNVGEELARRIETNLNLPNLWLDSVHGDGAAEASTTITAAPVDAGMSHVLRTSAITGLSVNASWTGPLAAETTAIENLFLSSIATTDMAPALSPGDTVIIDGAVKTFVTQGVYIVVVNDDVMLRRIRKTITGGFIVAAGETEERVDTLADIKVLGRIVRKIQVTNI